MDAQRGIARRMMVGIPSGGPTPAWERDFSAYPPAGVIVFRRDFEDLADLRRLTARLRELGGHAGCSSRSTRRAGACRSSPGA